MSVINDYKRQFAWRAWQTIFDSLPSVSGQTILDLGCAVGDQAAELVARGANVIGIDVNRDLLREAQSMHLANAEFREADLRALTDVGGPVDGLWCTFTAAYFPNLSDVIASWKEHLRLGGWIALTEIDNLFGHTPLSSKARALLEDYAQDAMLAGRYDFHMGRKLASHLDRVEFTIERVLVLDDQELSLASLWSNLNGNTVCLAMACLGHCVLSLTTSTIATSHTTSKWSKSVDPFS